MKIGWGVATFNKTNTNYGPMLKKIADKSIVTLRNTYSECHNMTSAPDIPEYAISLEWTYENCSSLETATKIPENIKDMFATFSGCTALKGNIEINTSSITKCDKCFEKCAKDDDHAITLTGTSTQKEALRNTAGGNKEKISISNNSTQ